MKYLITLLLFLGAVSLHGLVNVGSPTGNTTAPSGMESLFANVGSVNGSTGIYLGDGWVLTANHVGSGGTKNFTTSGGQTYYYDGVNAHRIGSTDLYVYKLSETPPLANLDIAGFTPDVNDDLWMVGGGRTPSTQTPTEYYVDTTTWAWDTEFFIGANATVDGYLTNSTKTIRWGENSVSGYDEVLSTQTYYTTFDQIGGATYEAQAVTNDSGGPVFAWDGERWVLSGIMLSVALYENQPTGANSAFFGNRTYIADLAEYRDEILSIVPEPSTFALLAGVLAMLVALRRQTSRHNLHVG